MAEPFQLNMQQFAVQFGQTDWSCLVFRALYIYTGNYPLQLMKSHKMIFSMISFLIPSLREHWPIANHTCLSKTHLKFISFTDSIAQVRHLLLLYNQLSHPCTQNKSSNLHHISNLMHDLITIEKKKKIHQNAQILTFQWNSSLDFSMRALA